MSSMTPWGVSLGCIGVLAGVGLSGSCGRPGSVNAGPRASSSSSIRYQVGASRLCLKASGFCSLSSMTLTKCGRRCLTLAFQLLSVCASKKWSCCSVDSRFRNARDASPAELAAPIAAPANIPNGPPMAPASSPSNSPRPRPAAAPISAPPSAAATPAATPASSPRRGSTRGPPGKRPRQ